MTLRTLLQRNLRGHWRSHLGVVLGALIGSIALIGALIVGDSVRGSLRQQAEQRLGATKFALVGGDRFFRAALADDFQQRYAESGFTGGDLVPVLQFPATMSRNDGAARVNRLMLHGVDERWRRLGGAAEIAGETNGVWLNEALAAQLQVSVGDTVTLRLPKPTALAAEVAISRRDDQTVVLRVPVAGIVSAAQLGNFSLRAGGSEPINAFMSLAELQRAAGITGQANLLLVTDWQVSRAALPSPGLTHAAADGAKEFHGALPIELLNCPQEMARVFTLADLQLQLRASDRNSVELVSPRIFLESAVADAARATDTNGRPLLTYLANQLRAGTRVTPYSMITAAGVPWTPAELGEDEIVLNQWLADDLQIAVGDMIAVSYFRPESGAQLVEATNEFRVHSIVPLVSPWSDRTLMPDFPGLEKAERTSDWDAGFPLTYEIRRKDDDYWRQYRGTPKAFITLAAGQKMWGNRFGNLTAIRFSVPADEVSPTVSVTPAQRLRDKDVDALQTNLLAIAEKVPHVIGSKEALERTILAHLKPDQLGLRFDPVREPALKAAAESQDFGGLFLGFSFFLIIAALLLMAMLFQFGLEQRAAEIGTLFALGFTPKLVRKLFLREGGALAFIGGMIGAIGGIYFAKAMLLGLSTIWRDAVGATSLNFHMTGQTLVIGLVASVVVSGITLWLALRRFVKLSPRELLAGEIHPSKSEAQSLSSKVIGGVALVLGLGLVGWAIWKGDTQNAGIFFGAGALVLVAGLSFVRAWLVKMEREAPAASDGKNDAKPELRAPLTTLTLAVRGCARRRGRSLATVAMLASGSFLILSIGVFRLDANRDAIQKTSGTGGFALIGETTMPVVQDLNGTSGRDFFALNDRTLEGVNVVPLRVRAGDEASCLNLNRAQKPRLLGVKPELLEGRFTFAKLADRGFDEKPWETLKEFYPKYDMPLATNEVAAIGDANSIQWAMGKKVGDTIGYVDERGQPFQVRLVGAVANSILQGQLLIDEAEFVKRFPGESGYRMFLIDAPSNRASAVAADLSRALQDVGLELTPAAVRLDRFNAVQNTYLGTFQILGGLGLLLGSVGLGVVVLRNVLERRSELAVWLAIGFPRAQVQRIVLLENAALLAAGLCIGTLAAGIAVLPAILVATAPISWSSLWLTLVAVLVNGVIWTWAATRYAVRGDLLAALRND